MGSHFLNILSLHFHLTCTHYPPLPVFPIRLCMSFYGCEQLESSTWTVLTEAICASKALSQTSVPVTYPLYIEMNDLSVHPIKKCQSLYSTKDEVKTAFVFLLINIYDRSAVRQGRVSCVSWLPWYLPVTSGRWQATDIGQRWGTRLE